MQSTDGGVSCPGKSRRWRHERSREPFSLALVQPAARQERPDRGAPVAPAVLLDPLHLAEGLPRPRHEEDRVVAEAGLAAPLGDDLAPALAVEGAHRVAGERR